MVDLSSKTSRKIAYGLVEDLESNFYKTKVKSVAPFIQIELLDEDMQLHALLTNIQGTYNAQNIAAAVAIGHYFKVNIEGIKEAIGSYIPSNNRSQLVDYNGARIFKDAYNANPDSMRVSIDSFYKSLKGEKLLILGDMKELGDYSLKAHQDLVDFVSNLEVDCVVVGPEFGQVALPEGFKHFDQVTTVKAWFDKTPIKGKAVLLKGSRSIGLERLLED